MFIRSIPSVFWIALFTGGLVVLLQFLKDLYYFGKIDLDMYAGLTAIPVLGIVYMVWRVIVRRTKKDIRSVLTQREIEVYQKILDNKTNTQIAEELFIEESTLKSHINRIYKKLDVRNRREVIEKASNFYKPA